MTSSEWRSRLLLCVASIVFCAVMLEGALRVSGYDLARPEDASGTGVNQPDERLGWVPKPGTRILPARSAGETAGAPKETVQTVLNDGRRSTGAPVRGTDNGIYLLGCSYTYGYGLSDDETFGWKLQRKLKRPVYNFGVPGYGTYQAFLRLEDALSQSATKPRYVIYGFGAFHADRNVPTLHWMRRLYQGGAYYPPIPYATLRPDGSLARHPPLHEAIDPLPFDSRLAVLVKETSMRLGAGWRSRQKTRTTVAIVRAMARLTHDSGAEFVVVNLAAGSDSADYATAFREAGARYVDCGSALSSSQYRLARRDLHPNPAANTIFAKCLTDFILSLEGRRS